MVRSAHEQTPQFFVGVGLWLAICVALYYHGLGVLAFFLSMFVAMYVFGLRDKFDSEQTASAYSVFNRNGQAIAGSLTATQLDRQLRGGGVSNANNEDASPSSSSNQGPATLSSTNSQKSPVKKSDNTEILRRRKAAAEAAERRAASQATENM